MIVALMERGHLPREKSADLEARLGIAQDGSPSPEQLQVQREMQALIYTAMDYGNRHIQDGRHKSIAMEHLEDALMRFGKAIFEVPR
ncbi:hypothetical protein SEA_GRASSBOY_58 [Microbacterium phage Grassboy]|nr:hypothetical protein SEA_GRASSBOY_58 [Microbacterium phage Grassboy]